MNNETKNKYGLTQRDMQTIRDILKKYPEVVTVYIFGSRAKGNSRFGSDIDLAIMNEGVDIQLTGRIKSDFDESSLPCRVDIVNYPALNNGNLKDHIDRVGVSFYEAGVED